MWHAEKKGVDLKRLRVYIQNAVYTHTTQSTHAFAPHTTHTSQMTRMSDTPHTHHAYHTYNHTQEFRSRQLNTYASQLPPWIITLGAQTTKMGHESFLVIPTPMFFTTSACLSDSQHPQHRHNNTHFDTHRRTNGHRQTLTFSDRQSMGQVGCGVVRWCVWLFVRVYRHNFSCCLSAFVWIRVTPICKALHSNHIAATSFKTIAEKITETRKARRPHAITNLHFVVSWPSMTLSIPELKVQFSN